MSDNVLNITIGGTVDPSIIQSAGKASAAVKDLGKTVQQVNNQINNITIINNYGKGLDEAGKKAGGATRGIKGVGDASDKALPALTDINRVIQDMPFGFVAIQNNLTQLPQSFGALKQATGSTGGAIKALLGSLTGPGGIGFALSLVTSAVTLATVGFSAWTRGFGSNKKAIDEAKEAAEAYAKALDSIRAGIADEASRVSVLVTALKNDVLTRHERKQAIDELKKTNPTYFGQLSEEKNFIENLTKSYTGYLATLKSSFEAKAIDRQLDDLFDKKVKIEAELDTKVTSSTNKQLSDLKARFEGELAKLGGVKIPTAEDVFKGNITEQQKLVFDLQKQILAIEKPITLDFSNRAANMRLASLNRDIDGLLLRRSKLGSTALGLKDGAKGATNKEDEQLKALKDELQGYQKQLEVTNKLREAGLLPLNRENDALDLQLKILKTLEEIDAREVAIKAKPSLEIDPELADLEITKAYKEFSERSGSKLVLKPFFEIRPIGGLKFDIAGSVLKDAKIPDNAFDGVIKAIKQSAINAKARMAAEIAESIRSAVIQGVIDGIATVGDTLGQAIGSAFTGGNIGSAIAKGGEALLGIIGGVLQTIGAKIIATSQLIVALQAALSSFSPAASLAVGIGLVALGGLMKSIKFDVPKFAQGGIATGPTLGIFGEAGTEAIIPLSKLPDLVGQMTGGGDNITLQPSILFSGASFRIMLNKTDERGRRMGG